MSNRVEEFVQALEEAEEGARQAWLAGLPLVDWWAVVKKDVVRPIFSDANSALKTKEYHAPDLFANGHTNIMLQAGNPCVNLSFSLNDSGIVVAFPGCEKNEIWSKSEFSEEAVRQKVLAFFVFLAQQRVQQRSLR